ncbi:MAG: zf-HC2 domain-containing protein [Gemmatimonadales bacterium]
MSHPDEGTIQMLLDGELDAIERGRVERHIAECASCAANLAEARAFLEEADRLVEVLAVPPRAAQPRASRSRRTLVRTLAWAASIVIAVGAGYWARGSTPLTPDTAILQDGEAGPTPNTAPPPLAARDEPVRAAVPAESGTRRDTDAGKTTGEAKAAAPARANELAPKAIAPSPASPTIAIRAERAAQPEALAADQAVSRWRVISMEEAVRLLGGQLRLIDGLTPDRVETGPGTAVAGADPALPLVRVVYAAGAVILDQQRPMLVADTRQGNAAKPVGGVGGVAQESSATAWQQQGEIRFVVTGNVSTDSLKALGERVR